MSLTLGLTGMDPATEAALKSAFDEANARLGGQWTLCPEGDADHVVVDMDSMYGPMSWLRLHAGGKHVIGLTSAPRTQTDFRLGRPFDGDQMERLLVALATHDGVVLERGGVASADDGAEPAHAGAQDHEVVSWDVTPAPAEVDAVVEASPEPAMPPAGRGTATTTDDPGGTATVPVLPATLTFGEVAAGTAATPTGAPSPATADPAFPPAPAPDPPPPSREPVFADWLVPGALNRRVRHRRESGPTLYIDPSAQTWHGPTPLKPIAGYFEGTVRADAFEPVDDVAWARETLAAGPAQPLARLRWLGGLVTGRGALLPGFDPDGRYQLNKWPQTEREYPKHFRIATAMMKGPATVADIAEASAMPVAEVADFFNANLATGFVEFVPEAAPAAPEPPKPAGLFGRLRSR